MNVTRTQLELELELELMDFSLPKRSGLKVSLVNQVLCILFKTKFVIQQN